MSEKSGSATTSPSGSQEVIRALERIGCDTVFGIPGIHNLDIYDELLGSGLTHITSRNEAGAAFMALGYGRATGRPGVALVITGPGLTNAATAVAEAYHDSVPMLLISSQLSRRHLERSRGELHELANSTTLASSFTKESRRVPSVDAIERYISEAASLAVSGRPGPVHVEIPLDLLAPGADEAEAQALEQAVSVLSKASGSCAIVAGGGATAAAGAVTELAERLGAPVVTTAAGKGVLDERHALSLGGRLHMKPLREYLAACEVVLAIGTGLSTTDLWWEPLEVAGTFINLNIEPGHLDIARVPDIALVGDCREVVPRLNEALEVAGVARDQSDRATGVARDQGDRATGISRDQSDRATGNASAVSNLRRKCDEAAGEVYGLDESMLEAIRGMLSGIRAGLPEEALFVADMTTPAYAGISEFECYSPGSYLHPAGYGTLGYALPTAVGAVAAEPGRPVCCLSGDGGFQFTSQELVVAVEAGMSLPVVVFNDGGYGEIRRTEELRHPGKRIAVDVAGPDFVAFAEALGAKGVRIDALAENVKREVQAALKAEGPTIIEVRV